MGGQRRGGGGLCPSSLIKVFGRAAPGRGLCRPLPPPDSHCRGWGGGTHRGGDAPPTVGWHGPQPPPGYSRTLLVWRCNFKTGITGLGCEGGGEEGLNSPWRCKKERASAKHKKYNFTVECSEFEPFSIRRGCRSLRCCMHGTRGWTAVTAPARCGSLQRRNSYRHGRIQRFLRAAGQPAAQRAPAPVFGSLHPKQASLSPTWASSSEHRDGPSPVSDTRFPA